MLRLATEADLPLLREWIVDGAKSGCFDAQLAQHSEESAAFFVRLRYVIREQIWLRRDLRQHTCWTTPACIWIFEDPVRSPGALGFAALRGAGRIGYELWLTAIGVAYRQKGIGKQMVGEVLGLSSGPDVVVAQCDRFADGARRMANILCSFGFESVRESKHSQWLAKSTLPTEVKDWIKSAPSGVTTYRDAALNPRS
jgi:hypothetical protein